jgi:transposase
MIPDDICKEILRLSTAEKWPAGTIASQLGVHHSVVRRVLSSQAVTTGMVPTRLTMLEPYLPFVMQTLEKYPRLPASRLFQMVKERGYPGAPDHFRSLIARVRPRRPAEAYLRLRTLPGEQGQVDWADFGNIAVDGGVRRLFLFLLVLSYSRRLFMRFFLNAAMGSFLQGHVQAFAALGGVPREILYDNLKSAVLERVGDAIRFHPTLLQLSSHYHFLPKPVAVARGNEKGRVERMVGYARTSFFPARTYQSIDDLNAQADEWVSSVADLRPCPEDRTRTVAQVFAQEQPSLLPLPGEPFPTEQRTAVAVGRTPYVRFDLNDYSVPHDRVRRTVTVLASPDTIRIMDAGTLVATHPRCWGRAKQIEDPCHVQALVDAKHAARVHRGMDRLHHDCPSCKPFFAAVAERGGNLGATTVGLTRMLDSFGAQALESALAVANQRATAHLGALRQILDQDRHARNQPPPVHLDLPDHIRQRSRAVRAHALSSYDSIRRSDADDIQV